MKFSSKEIAEAWVRSDRDVLDELSQAQRRAVGLIATGAACDDELEAAGDEFVRAMKAENVLFRRGEQHGTRLRAAQDDNVLEWVMSDETVDRAGDIIRQNWELRNYKRNPVILWGHALGFDSNADVPIGRALDIAVSDGALIGKLQFAVDEYDKAATVFRLAKAGHVNAGSVGFRPLKTTFVEDPGEREKLGLGRYGVVFERSELLEFSLCAVPCNPNALQNSLKSGAIVSADAELYSAIADPTEREWEKYVRRRARKFVDLGAVGSKETGHSGGETRDDGTGGAQDLRSIIDANTDALKSVAAGLRELAGAQRDIASALEESAIGQRAIARVISRNTDFRGGGDDPAGAGRPDASDPAGAGRNAPTGGGLTAADAERIRKQIESLKASVSAMAGTGNGQ